MVDDNQLYIGEDNVDFISVDGEIVKQIYFGSEKIYQFSKVVTFSPSSSLQTLYVPMGFHKLHIDCVASKGRTVTSGSYSATGGLGGRVQCDLSVNGGETLYIMVGDVPDTETPIYNASDIRIGGNTLNDRVIVAGGGGGGSFSSYYGVGYCRGGNGGNDNNGNGENGLIGGSSETLGNKAARGGTQSAGGAGAHEAVYATLSAGSGQLGLGGTTTRGGNAVAGTAGAGGAGYYGGGGGLIMGIRFGDSHYGSWAYSGAGGSSYTNASCTNVVHTQGYNDGAGYITISFVS